MTPPDARSSRGRRLIALVLAAVLGAGLAVSAERLVVTLQRPARSATSIPPSAAPRVTPPVDGAEPSTTPSVDAASALPAAERDAAVGALLVTRADSVRHGDRALFLSTVDPSATTFVTAQTDLVDRLSVLAPSEWTYRLVGPGPELSPERAAVLPAGAAIEHVRLTYRLDGSQTSTDREQYLTVVPHDGDWLLAADTDGTAAGKDSERDLWDLGPVRVVHGTSSLVVADRRGATTAALQALAAAADRAVRDVGRVWTGPWSHVPVLVLPRSQEDMATLIGSNGEGLAQIAAVTTGTFEGGRSRGDRVVINPAAWGNLGAIGRRVVLTHEITHVATRAAGRSAPPIWLSEGLSDYVAYRAAPLAPTIVASDVLAAVRRGAGPQHLPGDADFDASRGDIAASYEGAWLACRMIAARYGEERLVRLYTVLSDGVGPGWPDETIDVLGITPPVLERHWRSYLQRLAAA